MGDLRSATFARSSNKTPQQLPLDKMQHDNISQIPSTLQDGDGLLTAPLSVSRGVNTRSVNVIKLPRLLKSSLLKPHRSRSTIIVKIQPTKELHDDLNSSIRTRSNQRRASNVSVTRIKRTSLTDQITRSNQCTTTTSSNINLSRVTVIKMIIRY